MWEKNNTPTTPLKEIDYKALRLMMSRSDGPDFAKRLHLKKFDQAWEKGILFYCQEESQLQKWMRSEARFTLGDYSDWGGWEYRDKWSEKIWFKNPFKVPVWKGDYVETLYVVGEQGLGDEVLFSQCILDLKTKAKEVIFETQERLQSVFERSFQCRTTRAQIGADGIRRAKPFEADAWVSLGELPRAFRRHRESFCRLPFIRPDQRRVPELEKYRGMVGVSWRGAQGKIDWKKVKAKYPQALSLQYDQDPEEEEILRPHIDLRNDIEGVIALLSVLDKFVCCSTTAAHLAAASGVTMDLIIAEPKSGIRNNILPWRWLNLSDKRVPRKTLWYGDHVNVYSNWGEYCAHA